MAVGGILREEVVGRARLLLGDCLEVIDSLPPCFRVNATVTDPPYGIGFPYNTYEDTQASLEALVDGFVPRCRRISSRVVITPGVSNISIYPKPEWTGAWTWETTATFGKLGYSQWQPILFYGDDLEGFGSVNGAIKSDRIHFTGGAAKINHAEGKGHTCPKPLSFMRRLLQRFTLEGETVFDPFTGSGTTGVAAVQMGRRFLGVEIDPDYFEVACVRLEAAQRQGDMFIGEAA
jgi:DNA modification methylase